MHEITPNRRSPRAPGPTCVLNNSKKKIILLCYSTFVSSMYTFKMLARANRGIVQTSSDRNGPRARGPSYPRDDDHTAPLSETPSARRGAIHFFYRGATRASFPATFRLNLCKRSRDPRGWRKGAARAPLANTIEHDQKLLIR